MKNKKRLLTLLIALILCTVIACAALAEGKLLSIWNAGTALLFDTENVSLTGHATFTYDGELFKTFDGRYQQDGTRSYMQVMLDTPMPDGSVYTGGYTVVAEDQTAYSIETARPQIYTTQPTLANASILTNTVMRTSLLRFGGLLLDLMEDRMQGAITQSASEAGTQYQITLKEGETPEIAGAALTLLMNIVGREYLYVYPDQEDYLGAADSHNMAFTEDWDALFAAEYEKAFHEPLPADFYDRLWDENGNATPMQARFDMVSNLISMLLSDAEDAYETGVTLLLSDGSLKHYETYDEYVIAMGYEDVLYENYSQSFLAYYEQKTGTPLTLAELHTIQESSNDELFEQYITMALEMEDAHLAQVREGGYSCAMVYKDGTLEGMNDIRQLRYLSLLSDMTVTRRIFYTTTNIDVNTVDMAVTLDAEGRISSVTGAAAFTLTDKSGKTHDLAVDFTGLAFDYGASHVDSFDPAEYGVISAQEYYNGYSVNDADDTAEEEVVVLPESVVFDGVEYKVHPQGENG